MRIALYIALVVTLAVFAFVLHDRRGVKDTEERLQRQRDRKRLEEEWKRRSKNS